MRNLDEIHDLFLNEENYHSIKSIELRKELFALQLIGLAQLHCFDVQVIKGFVIIPFEKPHKYILDLIKTISYVCRDRHVEFEINRRHQFRIEETLFEFANFEKASEYEFSSKKDNECVFQDWEEVDRNARTYYSMEALIGAMSPGVGFQINHCE